MMQEAENKNYVKRKYKQIIDLKMKKGRMNEKKKGKSIGKKRKAD